MMKPGWLRACVLLSGAIASASSVRAEVQDIIESTFRNALVKIDVTSKTLVERDGKNICNSQGTGFLISSTHIVTAEHVLQLDPRCENPTILIKSRKHGIEQIATILASRDDIALLRTDALPGSMCSLVLKREDVYGTTAIRYGIPGDFPEPSPPVNVRIGEKDAGFAPLVVLRGAPAESGESGGPIIQFFNVVGVLKAKHKHYTDHSFMMVPSVLRALMKIHKPGDVGKICNPAELFMYFQDEKGAYVQPRPDLSPAIQKLLLQELLGALPSIEVTKKQGTQFTIQKNIVSIFASEPQIRQRCLLVGFLCRDELVLVPSGPAAGKAANAALSVASDRLWEQVAKAGSPP
jgi:hypothetical protein